MKSPKVERMPLATLTFGQAIEEVLTGKSVTKLEWGDKNYHAILADEKLKLHKPDDQLYDWLISEGDLRGDDYVIL